MVRRTSLKHRVRYDDGSTAVDYVDRTTSELWTELGRVHVAALSAVRVLSSILRLRNAIIISAYVQLKQLVRQLPDDAPPEAVAAEIARISYVMSTLVDHLAQLSNSRINNLQEARFILTYGQTPKKREPLANRPRVRREHDEQEDHDSPADYGD